MQNNLMCKVISLNVRGIRDQAKRRSIFSFFLKDQKASIYFLQETFSELKDETIWQNEWGGKMYFSHGSRHSKGTCILIDPLIIYNVQYFYSDNSGRIVLITVSTNAQLLYMQMIVNCLGSLTLWRICHLFRVTWTRSLTGVRRIK